MTTGPLTALGRVLVAAGLILVGACLVFIVVSRLGLSWRLPGDILIQKKNFTFFFPIVTMLLLSVVVSLVLNLFLRR
jgi:hypothetical protein